MQMHNVVKLFDLAQGSELRCLIMDTHRPLHLANVHSRYNVVVLDDTSAETDGVSSGSEYSDNGDEGSTDDDDEEDDDAEVIIVIIVIIIIIIFIIIINIIITLTNYGL